ncbi:MAG TPA: hypothetical protein VFD58_10665 [Blastocatellia bacterium]|nr:hypothetical protein [Blastocatellia bacterium]
MSDKITTLEVPEYSADELWEAAEEPDGFPRRPPVGLLSVARSLSRNWQALDRPPRHRPDEEGQSTKRNSPGNKSPDQWYGLSPEDEHYLSIAGRLSGRTSISEPDSESELLAEIWRLVTRKTQEQVRALREAREQLASELERFSRFDR